MSKETLKLALEALELMYSCYAHPKWISHKQQEEKILAQCAATTMTLRQALAKQEQGEPVAWYIREKDMLTRDANWVAEYPDMCEPLYTTSQQRTWVGLTTGETAIIVKMLEKGNLFLAIAAVEAKLKEKNT